MCVGLTVCNTNHDSGTATTFQTSFLSNNSLVSMSSMYISTQRNPCRNRHEALQLPSAGKTRAQYPRTTKGWRVRPRW